MYPFMSEEDIDKMITKSKIHRILRAHSHYESVEEGLILREAKFDEVVEAVCES